MKTKTKQKFKPCSVNQTKGLRSPHAIKNLAMLFLHVILQLCGVRETILTLFAFVGLVWA